LTTTDDDGLGNDLLRGAGEIARYLGSLDGSVTICSRIAAYRPSKTVRNGWICREAARQANDGKLQVALSANQKIAAVTTMARSDRRTVATTDQWDRDPWLLNMPGVWSTRAPGRCVSMMCSARTTSRS
jgi:hypothetical protein